MDFQFFESNSEIVIELPQGSIHARRMDAHSTRILMDDSMEGFVRVFASNNRVLIKSLANVSPEIELRIPAGVKSMKVIGGDLNLTLTGFTLDSLECNTTGELVLEEMEIRRRCIITNENGKITANKSFLRALNLQMAKSTFEASRSRLRGSSTIFLEDCRVNCGLLGFPGDYMLVPRGNIQPNNIVLNERRLSDVRQKESTNCIVVAGRSGRKFLHFTVTLPPYDGTEDR